MKFLIIDSSYLIYRSYFAFAKNHLTVNKDGQELITSAIFGFINELIMLQSDQNYDFIFTSWDTGPYLKKLKYPSYKEGRHKGELPDFNAEKEIIKAILFDLNIPVIYATGFEGEEVARTIINSCNAHQTHLYSNDQDCFVLLDDNVDLIRIHRGEIIFFDQQDLMDKYRVTPKQFRHWKALTGCSTDNVKGVQGIGPKSASDLISKFHSVKGVLKHIDQISPKQAEKILKAKEDGTLKSSMYLTKIQAPKDIQFYKPEERLSYLDILDYVEARSFLKGEKKLILKAIKKRQKENKSCLPKRVTSTHADKK